MTQSFTPDEIHHVIIDGEDPKTRAEAVQLTVTLVSALGLGKAAAVLLVALECLLSNALHAVSPMPEANIQAITVMLDTLREHVLAHVSCAREINGIDTKTH